MDIYVDYEYTFEDVLGFVRMNYRVKGKYEWRLVWGLRLLIAGALAAYLIVCAVRGEWGTRNLAFAILGILFLSIAFLKPRVTARMTFNNMVAKGLKNHYDFTETGIVSENKTGRSECKYGKIVELMVKDRVLYAYFGTSSAVVLPERGVKGGTFEELCALLSERTGREITKIE